MALQTNRKKEYALAILTTSSFPQKGVTLGNVLVRPDYFRAPSIRLDRMRRDLDVTW